MNESSEYFRTSLVINLCNTDNPEKLPEGILLQTKSFTWEFVQTNSDTFWFEVSRVGNK